ncbi:IucA/IucC family protein [Alkalihalobacillus sp. CinArs1]|uniref:IucA/IucC family protein n=1 Tax=Alkalihalobacillus sp. CinArs1 TaxID=2995314 RepID=UPI0022DDECE8|nr:IucA/IucC family protein [Alkalihalobacillus sp. CinArs1]
MKHAKDFAERATMQSFLNCYLRETSHFYKVDEFYDALSTYDHVISCPLSSQGIELLIPINYWSLTGRHLFHFPMYYKVADSPLLPLDYVTLTSLIIKEILLDQNKSGSEDELVMRVLLSKQSIESTLNQRYEEREELSEEEFEFIETEQSLLLGHLLHPTPKSKQGLSERDNETYSPEWKGSFQLHYFSAHPSIVIEDSALDRGASELIKEELSADQEWLEQFDHLVLIPVHPLQAMKLLEQEDVQNLLLRGDLQYIGPAGKPFSATSSFRTVYNKDSEFMYKFSVPVKITNSLRINQQKELDRGVEVSRLLSTAFGKELNTHFPSFDIMQDPAYINIEGVKGFETVIRENPFKEVSKQATCIAALCQDNAFGGKSRLSAIIHGIARREKRSLDSVSSDWFKEYLDLSLEPMLWLHHEYGLSLEAHQQNSVVVLEDGYPKHFYYRDNQGYYFSESKAHALKAHLPSLNDRSDTICSDEVAVERFTYYLFFNHLFGLINGFGSSGLIRETDLIDMVRSRLASNEHSDSSPLIKSLLNDPVISCKANLLTRLYDMDELVGSLATQSVYTMVQNPIAKEVKVTHEN